MSNKYVDHEITYQLIKTKFRDERQEVFLCDVRTDRVYLPYLYDVKEGYFISQGAVWYTDEDGYDYIIVLVCTDEEHDSYKPIAVPKKDWDMVWEMIYHARSNWEMSVHPVSRAFWQFCSLNEDYVPLIGYESEDGDDYAEEEEGEE